MIARVITAIAADARQTFRSLRAVPWLTAVVVISLGVGIAVNTVVFSWIQARVLRPLPGVARAASYYFVEPKTEGGLFPGLSWPEYEDLRSGLDQFDGLIASRPTPLYVGASGETERVSGQLVSDNYFAELGLVPVIGRFIGPDDAAKGASEPVAVISYGLWQSRFAGSALNGRTIRINGRNVSVAGVAPRDFQGTTLGLFYDIWLPSTSAPLLLNGSRELLDRSARSYTALGRLRPGVTQAQAQAQLDAAMQRLTALYPQTNAGIHAEVLGIRQAPRGPQRTVTSLFALQAVMMLLLVAVCGNVSNLLLARASARQREMAIRLALGSARWRITSLLVAEGLILALLGAALGALLAVWGARALLTLPLTGLPIRFQTDVDGGGLLVALGLGVFSGVLSAVAPAIRLSRVEPQRALRDGTREAARSRLRDGLMAVQAAFALIVLIIAGLFVQSFVETRDIDPGFKSDGVLLAAYDLRGRAATPEAMRAFADALLTRLREQPAVQIAAVSSSVPLDIHGLPLRMFEVEGSARSDGNLDQASSNTVTRGYFDLLRIPFRAGHDFAELNDPSAPPQAIVNETFARRFLSGVEPVGRRITARGRQFTIVGVVADSISNAFGEPPTPVLYLSYRDNPQPLGDIHVRVRAGSATDFAPEIRRIAREIDPELPLFNVRTLTAHVDSNLLFRLLPARMFVVLGPLLLVLAAVGIYASVAYTASQQAREIGIRLALGASRTAMIVQFMRRHLAIVAGGMSAGWLLAFVVIWKRATDVAAPIVSFVGVPAALLAVAAVACWLPARRASRVSPAQSMRAR